MEDIKVKDFLSIDSANGNGYGDGNGNGYGDGDGYGNGNGYGNCYGYGYGNGYGNGDGYGYGYGNGYGYGYGDDDDDDDDDGDGYGYDDGYDDGYSNGYGYGNDNGGIKSINGQTIYLIDSTRTIITHIHGNIAKGYIVVSNAYLKPCYIVKGNGYFAHGETLNMAREALEQKIITNLDTEAKIEMFCDKFRLGIKYPARDFYDWHNTLTGSCVMGRNAFAANRGIDVDTAKYTVEEFIELTKDSFGGDVICQLAERIGLE